MKKKRLLITGGLGFIGLNLVKRLCNSYNIIIIDWNTSLELHKTVHQLVEKLIIGDIADKFVWDGLKTCDIIIHAAAQTSAEKSKEDPGRDWMTNVYGTFQVAEFAKNCKAKIIFFNSIRVYDPYFIDDAILNGKSISEDFPTIEKSKFIPPPFAISKYLAEQILNQYSLHYGLQVISNRMSGIVGPNQIGNKLHGWLTFIIECAISGQEYEIYGTGDQSRDVLHINDYVDLISMELDDFTYFSELGFAFYNIGGGVMNRLSINKVIQLLLEQGYKLNFRNFNFRQGEPFHYVSDLNKINKKGWGKVIQKTDFIINEIITWHLNRKKNGEQEI